MKHRFLGVLPLDDGERKCPRQDSNLDILLDWDNDASVGPSKTYSVVISGQACGLGGYLKGITQCLRPAFDL